jgi:phosphoserine phosphatase
VHVSTRRVCYYRSMEKLTICYDIDGTLSTDMLAPPLIQAEHAHGLIGDRDYASIMGVLRAYKMGEIEYEAAVQLVLGCHANGLRGQEESVVANHAVEFVHEHTDLLRAFGKKLITALGDSALQFAVTAEPQYVADAVAKHLGLDGVYATTYEIVDGRYTGRVVSSLAHRSAKDAVLTGRDIVAAFGDSEGDEAMLAAARHAFCISPTEGLKEVAILRGWHVLNGDESEVDKVLSVLGV